MVYFAYTDTEIGSILGGFEGDASFLNVPSIIDLYRNYETDTKRLCTLELHLITLGSQLRSNMFTTDCDFRTRYEQISNKYALDLILLNIEHLQKELLNVRSKVRDLELPKQMKNFQNLYPNNRKWRQHQKNQKSTLQHKSDDTTIEEKVIPQKVVNISSVELSPIHLNGLSKGLSFCPNAKPDWFQLELDLTQLFKRLKL